MRRPGLTGFAVAFGLVLLMTAPASAVVVEIDFQGRGAPGGTVTFNGINATGTGIPFDLLSVIAPPTSSILTGAFPISAALNFDTSALTIQVVSTAPITIGGSTLAAGLILASGTMDTFGIETDSVLGVTRFRITSKGPDEKSADLLLALGIDPSGASFRFFEDISGSNAGGGFTTNARAFLDTGDVAERPRDVSQPASLMLIGSVLVAGFAYARLSEQIRARKG